jgi:hypothetical protein
VSHGNIVVWRTLDSAAGDWESRLWNGVTSHTPMRTEPYTRHRQESTAIACKVPWGSRTRGPSGCLRSSCKPEVRLANRMPGG